MDSSFISPHAGFQWKLLKSIQANCRLLAISLGFFQQGCTEHSSNGITDLPVQPHGPGGSFDKVATRASMTQVSAPSKVRLGSW
jgi:hypothetical protein